jgi:predicted dehydrogenase
MADKIRVGIIGLGRISSLHLPAYLPQNKLNAELVAVCDSDKSKTKAVAKEYNVEKTFTDYKDMLKDNTIDAVEILTPHHVHLPMTLAAAQAGKHISLQKVPAMTLSEMDQMIHTANQHKIWFRVFENFRFYPPYMKAMEIIKDGIIGTVDRVDYNMVGGVSAVESWKVPLSAWKWRISEKGNYRSPTVFDDGYHKHSMIAQFLDDSIESVLAWQGVYRVMKTVKMDTPTVIVYSCKNKSRYGVWNTSTHDHVPMKSKYYGCDEWVEIFGSKGSVWIPGCTGSWFEDACKIEGPTRAGVHWIGKNEENWHSITDIDTDWGTSFINCSREFVEAIRANRQPEVNPQEARYILQIGLAILTSIRNNFREVKIKEITDGIKYDKGNAEKFEEENTSEIVDEDADVEIDNSE